MKVTLDISDGIICAFLCGVEVTDTGMQMFSYQLDREDLKDGGTVKLPRDWRADDDPQG